jgi:hypothetical protein
MGIQAEQRFAFAARPHEAIITHFAVIGTALVGVGAPLDHVNE